MNNNMNENYTFQEYFRNIVTNDLEIFRNLTMWSDKTKKEFSDLLEDLNRMPESVTETTRSIGDKLENIVKFIIDKSFFFKVHKNIHTASNEIDEIIVLSDEGKQALHKFDLSRELLQIDSNIVLGECKNYSDPLNVTYVGKFYSLLISTGVNFGIIFTKMGLTGKPNEFHDAYGLIKVLRIIEKYQNQRDLRILWFDRNDYKLMAEGVSFYKLIETKKISLDLSTRYEELLKQYSHDNSDEIKKSIDEITS